MGMSILVFGEILNELSESEFIDVNGESEMNMFQGKLNQLKFSHYNNFEGIISRHWKYKR
jgi:hypothetical protein